MFVQDNQYLGDYVPIQNLDLEGDTQVTFDLYLGMPRNQRVVLYCRKGGVIENHRLEKFVSRKECTLFVHRDHYMEFVTYVSERIGRLLDVTPENDSHFILGSVVKGMLSGTFDMKDAAMTRVMMHNLNEVSSVLIERTLVDMSKKGRRAYKGLLSLASNGTDFQKHPVNVASLTVMMCFGSGLASQRSLGEVAVAALLHDVGLAKLPGDLALKAHVPNAVMDLEEKIYLNRHISMTFEVLRERDIEISELTRLMIEQHHEYYNGFGLPNRLRGSEINTFAQILHMADDIDQAIFGSRSQNPNADLMSLFEKWSDEKAFDPLLLARIRTLFFMV